MKLDLLAMGNFVELQHHRLPSLAIAVDARHVANSSNVPCMPGIRPGWGQGVRISSG